MNTKEQPRVKLHFQRFEFKYQLPLQTIEGILPELLGHMDVDPFALGRNDNSYRVSSLYYDAPTFDAYYEKQAGLRSRKKLRVRFYDNKTETGKVFLEIKRKYDAVVVKDRVTMTEAECKRLIEEHSVPEAIPSQQKATLEEFLSHKLLGGMLPQIMVIYNRKPLISRVDPNFRVTIDSRIRTFRAHWLDDGGIEQPVDQERAILEVKFNNILPRWFHRIIQANSLTQKPFSKYSNALELVHPELRERGIPEIYNPHLSFAYQI